MKKHIATLNIYVTDENKVTGIDTDALTKVSDLYINPKGDADALEEEYSRIDDGSPIKSIIAHELGHFLDNLGKKYFLNGLFMARTPAEIRAWNYAEKIYPDLSQKLKKEAIDGYRQGDQERQQDLVGEIVRQLSAHAR